jgi:hypothetical protein
VARSNTAFLGGLRAVVTSTLIEALYLAGRSDEIRLVASDFLVRGPDPRHVAESIAAQAIAHHSRGNCRGECLRARKDLDIAESAGQAWRSCAGRVKLAVLASEHHRSGLPGWAWRAIREARALGLWPSLRPWLRRLAGHAATALSQPDGAATLAGLVMSDPDGWRKSLVPAG